LAHLLGKRDVLRARHRLTAKQQHRVVEKRLAYLACCCLVQRLADIDARDLGGQRIAQLAHFDAPVASYDSVNCGAAGLHSPRMPTSLMSLPMRAISDFIVAASCCGVLPTTSTPALKNLSLTLAWFSTCTVSRFKRSTIAVDVLAGA